MTLVLTNDDGIDAPGLAALEQALQGIAPLVVVAPAQEWSGCGHRVTTGAPVVVERRAHGRYCVAGTPGDCVRLALHALTPTCSWVIAGINHGGNLGADVVHSGTVAAAREAVLHGRPAIAISHYRRQGAAIDWAVASAWVRAILPPLLAGPPLPPGRLWNLNLPHLRDAVAQAPPAVVRCVTDPSPLPLDYAEDEHGYRYRGDYHGRARLPGMDIDTCFGGRIALAEVGLW